MEIRNKIAPYQIFSLLFLCRVFASLVYLPNIQPKATAGITIISILVANIILAILLLPIFSLISRQNQMDICDFSSKSFGKVSKVLLVIYALYFIYVAINTLSYCNFFITSSLFTNANVMIITAMLLLVCIYGVTVGIEAIARFSTIALIFVVVSFSIILLSVTPKADILNITWVGDDMLMSFIKSVNFNISQNSEIVLTLVLSAFSTKDVRRGYLGFLGGISVFFVVLSVALISVLGKFLSTQIFPIYTLSTMAEIPVLERLDALHISMWILMGVIKATVYIFSAIFLLKKMCGEKSHKILEWIVYLFVFWGVVIISKDVKLITFTDNLQYKFLFVLLIGLALPIILAILSKIKLRKVR